MAEKDEPNVHQAYALETPEDSKRLYASWASTYDSCLLYTSDAADD